MIENEIKRQVDIAVKEIIDRDSERLSPLVHVGLYDTLRGKLLAGFKDSLTVKAVLADDTVRTAKSEYPLIFKGWDGAEVQYTFIPDWETINEVTGEQAINAAAFAANETDKLAGTTIGKMVDQKENEHHHFWH